MEEVDSSNYGYKKLIIWQKAKDIRIKIYQLTKKFPQAEYRRISQMRDAARSVKQNMQEGYFKSTKSYLSYLSISRGSLNELKGDVDDCFDDGLITADEYKELDKLMGVTEYLIIRTIEGLRKKLEK